jgi:pyruvate-ferredoxin/flavodoxin oxidoreductase
MAKDRLLGDPASLLVECEAAACEAVFVGGGVSPESKGARQVASAAEAVRAAAASPGRAAAVIGADALLEALGAIAEAAAARAPIVVHVVPEGGTGARRGRDELAPALDLGAGVVVSWSAQEAVDLAAAARRAAEDSETPFLHLFDGPRGPAEAVAVPASFLGEARAARGADGDRSGRAAVPARGAVAGAEAKRGERGFAGRVPFALASALRDLAEASGRPLATIERFETSDAEEVLVGVGAAYPPALALAQALRAEGRRVGAAGVRALRPFPSPDLVKAVARARAVIVLEPLDVALAPCGPAAAALKVAFADALTWAPGFPGVGRLPAIVSALFATTEAGGIAPRDVRAALDEIGAGDRARRVLSFGSDAPRD